MNRAIALAIFLAGSSLACDDGTNAGGKCLEGEPIPCTPSGKAVDRLPVEPHDADVEPVEVTIRPAVSGPILAPACYLELPRLPRIGAVDGQDPVTLEFVIRNRRDDSRCTVERIGFCEGTDPAFSLPAAPTVPLFIPGGGELVIVLQVEPDELVCTGPEDAGCIELGILPSPEPIRTLPLFCLPDWEPAVFPIPSEIDFGRVEASCKMSVATIELVNGTSKPVTTGRIQLGDGTSDEFYIRSFPPERSRLAAGRATNVTVAYRPKDEGVDQATLLVWFEELEEPLAVPIRGEGFYSPMRENFTQVKLGPFWNCLFLRNQPDDPHGADVRVWVDDVELPERDAGGPWWYDAGQTAVCFDPERLPPPGANVEIEYRVSCLSW